MTNNFEPWDGTLTDLPELAAALMKWPWSEGCDEAIILDELRIAFLCGGVDAVVEQLGLEFSWEINSILAGPDDPRNAKFKDYTKGDQTLAE